MKLLNLSKLIEEKFYQRLLPKAKIDFTKKWWNIYKQYFVVLFISLILISGEKLFQVSLPFLFDLMFTSRNLNYLWLMILLFLVTLVISPLAFQLMSRIDLQMHSDIDLASNNLVLSIDPINHTTKSSSLFISKIKKGHAALSGLSFNLCLEIPTKLMFFLTAIVSLSLISIWLGGIAMAMTVLTVFINFLYIKYVYKAIQGIANSTDNSFVSFILDNISQASLIRATFAATERHNEAFNLLEKRNLYEMHRTHSHSIVFQLTRTLIIGSIIFVGYFLYLYYLDNKISVSYAIAVLSTYLISSFQLIDFGGQLLKMATHNSMIEEMWQAHNDLGQQTFKVLNMEKK
jgi:ABC-type bacteriocin/lantibiotic exporter with double-glycine peptidase domain